ncbi:hypothetical protein BDF21DRAFT_159268 [Thamnidium elegans]|nr:hypothetical protein BDF21DRAFT_159268 [Thamnidium elegans]
MGTAVNVPNKGQIYYWGGLSGQYPGYPVNTTTILSTKTPMYTWSVCPGVLPLGTFTRFGHTATLDNDGINIFYLGGRIRTVNVTTVDEIHSKDFNLIPYNIIPMNKILSYNTIDGTWSARESPSAPTMSSRYMHSANLLPYSGKILIYGGATDDGNEKHPSAVSDYLYLFDPKTLEYTRIVEYEQSQGAGPRFGHSAILCNNTLFVLFGVNQKGLITNDVYFLSLSNSATWLATFSLLGGDGPDNKVGGTWLSNQAIIGITIGSVLVIIFLLVGSIYMIHTTRSKKKKLLQEQEDFKQKLEDSNLPQLHKQYQRYSTVDSIQMSGQERYFNNNNIPNEYDTYVISSDSVTLHDNIPPRGFSYDHLVIPSSINIHKPNQVKDQQPLTFIEGQQQQSSTGSFFLQPITPVSNTSSVPSASVVKPSVYS